MKRIITASNAQDRAIAKAKTIKQCAQTLLNVMEDTPSGFLDANDLGPLYEELIEVLPALSLAINTKNIDIN